MYCAAGMNHRWRVAVHKLSGQINLFAECDTLAVYLELIEGHADPVRQIREHQLTGPCDVAFKLMSNWLANSTGQSPHERKTMLTNAFKQLKGRQDLVLLLNKLIKVCSDCAAQSCGTILTWENFLKNNEIWWKSQEEKF